MDTIPPDHWVAASHALGRPVSVLEVPTPHICHRTVTGRMTGRTVTTTWRDCAACAERTAARSEGESAVS